VQFTGAPVYLEGQAPSGDEIAARTDTYWRPYHEALQARTGAPARGPWPVLLWEGHSIKGSDLDFLFPGRLPDLQPRYVRPARVVRRNARRAWKRRSRAQSRYDFVVNGRFKGGYITRHYADPANGIDAIQLEIGQRIYMDEATFAYDEGKAADAQA
jgi:N-formylglutamate deformylase